MFPGIVTACVKHATGSDACDGPDDASARRLTAEKVAQAIARLRAGGCQPFQPTLPMTVAIRMASAQGAEAAAQRPGVTRLDDRTVEARVSRHCDVVQWIVSTGLDIES